MTRPTPEILKQLGVSLREIDPSHLMQEDESGLKVRWYLGDNATELYAWTVPATGEPDHVQLVFAGVSVEWSLARGLATGAFKTGSSTMGGRYDPYLLASAGGVDRDVCEAALLVLRSSAIDARLTAALVKALGAAVAPT